MDTLTHALSGALLARATWNPNKPGLTLRHRTLVGFLVAAFPDLDYILRLLNDNLLVYLNYHRGITHSVLMLPIWALILAVIFSRLLRTSNDWRPYYLLCCLSIGIHIAGDLITSYGTMIFAPVADTRVWLDTTFIIDPYFSLIIIIGLTVSYLKSNVRLYAGSGLLILTAYIGIQHWAHERAIEIGRSAAAEHWWHNATISAIPQPLSAFNWKIIIEHKQHYHSAMIKLSGNQHQAEPDAGFFTRLAAAYQNTDSIKWTRYDRYGYDRYDATVVRQAWLSDTISDFRRFTRFPVRLDLQESDPDCYWFGDLRFILPARENFTLFTYGLCPAKTTGGYTLENLD